MQIKRRRSSVQMSSSIIWIARTPREGFGFALIGVLGAGNGMSTLAASLMETSLFESVASTRGRFKYFKQQTTDRRTRLQRMPMTIIRTLFDDFSLDMGIGSFDTCAIFDVVTSTSWKDGAEKSVGTNSATQDSCSSMIAIWRSWIV